MSSWEESILKIDSPLEGNLYVGSNSTGIFLLLGNHGSTLGVPLYDELKRDKRELIWESQRWGDEEWPPERIIETYGPATVYHPISGDNLFQRTFAHPIDCHPGRWNGLHPVGQVVYHYQQEFVPLYVREFSKVHLQTLEWPHC